MIINAEFRETKEVAAAVGELRGQGSVPSTWRSFSSKPVELEPGCSIGRVTCPCSP